MTLTWRLLLFLIVTMSLFQPVYAQQAQTVVLTEPGIIRLENLFQMADTVALVEGTFHWRSSASLLVGRGFPLYYLVLCCVAPPEESDGRT
jgi:hypothetical protein